LRKYYIHILLIVLGTALYFLAHFQRVAVPAPIFDLMQSELNISATKITSFSAIFMYSYAVSTLFCGVLTDKFGGVKILLFGSIIFSLGSVLFSNTLNLPLMYFARSLTGLGAATFYLGLLHEAKKCFPDKYFGVALSIILFIGYTGGVCANAPFVAVSEIFGWKKVLNIIAIISIIVTLMFILIQYLLKSIHENDKVHICFEPFKRVLQNKNNFYIFTFTILCTGLHYVMMTVLGVKFLKDFLGYSLKNASLVLSFLVVIAAFSGVILAYLSKLIGNKRLIFLRMLAFISFIVFSIISICILLNIKTSIIAGLILLLAVNGGNTPLAVPIVANTNSYEIRTTAISVMNSISFVFVGLMATFIGFLMDLFPIAGKFNGHIIYSNKSYLTVFLFFAVLAVVEIFMTFKIKEKV